MKKFLFILTLVVLFSCDQYSQEPICFSQEMTIIDLEKKIEDLFQENGILKEELSNCEGFIREQDSTAFNFE